MFELISAAHAEGGAGQGNEALMGNIVFMVLLFGIFYFLLIRPQQKQAKEHKEMVSGLARGDNVVVSGMLGKVHKVDDDVVVLDIGEVETAPRTFKPVRAKFRRTSVTAVTSKADGSTADKS